ncbi:MAG: hypothetical protein ACC662_09500 [Planctomycetota bacterium]
MVKSLLLVAGFMMLVGGLGGCRLAAAALESVGGCPYPSHGAGHDTKTKAMFRQWGHDARSGEQFIDQYFLNYDVNDPYRGSCWVGY